MRSRGSNSSVDLLVMLTLCHQCKLVDEDRLDRISCARRACRGQRAHRLIAVNPVSTAIIKVPDRRREQRLCRLLGSGAYPGRKMLLDEVELSQQLNRLLLFLRKEQGLNIVIEIDKPGDVGHGRPAGSYLPGLCEDRRLAGLP